MIRIKDLQKNKEEQESNYSHKKHRHKSKSKTSKVKSNNQNRKKNNVKKNRDGKDRVRKDRKDRVRKDRKDRVIRDRGDRVKRDREDRVKRDRGDRVKKDREDRVKRDREDRVKRDRGDRVKRDRGDRVKRDRGDRVKRDRGDRVKKDREDRDNNKIKKDISGETTCPKIKKMPIQDKKKYILLGKDLIGLKNRLEQACKYNKGENQGGLSAGTNDLPTKYPSLADLMIRLYECLGQTITKGWLRKNRNKRTMCLELSNYYPQLNLSCKKEVEWDLSERRNKKEIKNRM